MIAGVADAAFERVASLAPDGVEVRRLDDDLAGAEFLVPEWGSDLDLADLRSLRVVQVLSAGTEWVEDRLPQGVTLCNARGARDVPVAEWVLGALLGAVTGLLEAAQRREWRHAAPSELAGSLVVIVGYGSIGRAVAERLEPMGATVEGVGRARLHELPTLLPRADAVVVLAPLTDDTRGLVDAEFLAGMRDGALFLNAGRGPVVDTGALLGELEHGRLRAVLDVVDPEPLPADHPLWSAKGTLAITSHQAGDSPRADERAAELAGRQLARLARGEPLENVVREAGA